MGPGWITGDAVGLGIIGIAASLRGISYLPHVLDQSRKAAHFLEEKAPLAQESACTSCGQRHSF